MLKETIAELTQIRIVLGEQVVAGLAARYHLPLVRYREAFDDACRRAPAGHWSWNGVHPHYAGHGLMVE